MAQDITEKPLFSASKVFVACCFIGSIITNQFLFRLQVRMEIQEIILTSASQKEINEMKFKALEATTALLLNEVTSIKEHDQLQDLSLQTYGQIQGNMIREEKPKLKNYK